MSITSFEKSEQTSIDSRTQVLHTRALVKTYDCPYCDFILFGSPEHCPSCGMSVDFTKPVHAVVASRAAKAKSPKIVNNRAAQVQGAEWGPMASNVLTGAFGLLLVTLAALALRR